MPDSGQIRIDDPAGAEPESLHRRALQLVRQVGAIRLVLTVAILLAALLVARFSWSIPFADELERVLYDVRASYAMEPVEEDQRIAIVVYTEDTLIDTEVRSPLDRTILADALSNLDEMGAQAVGIDILFDQSTPNDEALISALRGMETPTYFAFVSSKYNPLTLTARQEDFLADFTARTDTDAVGQASVLLYADDDNVMRSWSAQPRDIPPLMGNALAPGHEDWRDHDGSLAYRLPLYEDGAVFTKLPIDWFADPAMAPAMASFIEGRYVLIGTDLQDRDRFETPLSRLTNGLTIPGVEVHAHLMAQMLDGFMMLQIPGWALWFTAFVVISAGAATSLAELKWWQIIPLIVFQAAVLVLAPFFMQDNGVDTQDLPVFGWALGWIAAFSSVGAAARAIGAEKREFVTGALGKYLPGDVAAQILSDPDRLSLHGEKREIYALFTDLEGFTKLSHAIEPEMVAYLLNRYLDMLSETVLEHGGTLDKFIGDAIVAFWGAPISRPDDAERAAQCAVAMYKCGEAFRADVPDGVPPIGKTRVGLHRGEAIVGNFGGKDRIQYTALGDSMNTAARLESANKQTDSSILISGDAIAGVTSVAVRPLGRVVLSGRSTPVEIFEPMTDTDDESWGDVGRLYDRYEAGDEGALAEMESLSNQRPDDSALRSFVERLKETKPGASYVFKGK